MDCMLHNFQNNKNVAVRISDIMVSKFHPVFRYLAIKFMIDEGLLLTFERLAMYIPEQMLFLLLRPLSD